MSEKKIEDLIALVENAVATDEQSRNEVQESLRSFAAFQEEQKKAQQEMADRLAAAEERAKKSEELLQLQVVGQTMDQIHSFSQKLLDDGKITPVLLPKVEALLQVAANTEGEVRSFALGDVGDLGNQSVFGLMQDVLESLPSVTKVVTKQDKKTLGTATGDTVDMRRYSADPEAATAMHKKVTAVQKEKNISYMAAFELVRAELIGQEE